LGARYKVSRGLNHRRDAEARRKTEKIKSPQRHRDTEENRGKQRRLNHRGDAEARRKTHMITREEIA